MWLFGAGLAFSVARRPCLLLMNLECILVPSSCVSNSTGQRYDILRPRTREQRALFGGREGLVCHLNSGDLVCPFSRQRCSPSLSSSGVHSRWTSPSAFCTLSFLFSVCYVHCVVSCVNQHSDWPIEALLIKSRALDCLISKRQTLQYPPIPLVWGLTEQTLER
jgi:hypothetical protein